MLMGAFSMLLAAGIPVAATVVAVILFRNRLHAAISRGPTFTGAAVAGNARVIAVQPTGSSVQRGGLPPEYCCHISLRVLPCDGEPYDATITQLVDSMALPNIGPGSTVAVQVDSANPQNVMIDFNQPIRQAAA
jgi:hypothetical protein